MKSDIDVWQELFQSILQGLLASDTEDKITMETAIDVARQGADIAFDLYEHKKSLMSKTY